MKRVVFLGGLSSDDETTRTPYAEHFSERLGKYEFTNIFFDDLLFHFRPGVFSIKVNDMELKDYDLVIFRGKLRTHLALAYIICSYLSENGVEFFNDYSIYRPMPKLTQTYLFYRLGVPFAETYYSLDPVKMAAAAKELGYPLILKDNYGSHGLNNYLVKDWAELTSRLNGAETDLLAQKYHPNENDYRVLTAGEQPPLVIKRSAASGSHLNNTSQGGSAELSDLPKEYLVQSQRLAKELGMRLAGVDILQDKNTGEMLFLEVNSQPQIVTGAFVDEKNKLFGGLLDSIL